MDELVDIWEYPEAEENYMLVGWRQWADAGAISSSLPEYLIEQTNARKIGEIKPGNFYLFQVPGTHHFLRPEINLKDGFTEGLSRKKNEIYYTGDERKGFFIFLGDEPHLAVDSYGAAFFDAVEALDIQRVVGVGGVYGPMPYDKDRDISCAYSIRGMQEDLSEYAVRFSSYEGGATIGAYMLSIAEERDIEFLIFYGFVPAYDFSQIGANSQGIRIDTDYKAWYDLTRRVNYMFDLGLDLTDLEQQSRALLDSMEQKIETVEAQMPQLKIRDYLEALAQDFTERPFIPLSDIWEEELGDLFDEE